MTYTVKVTLAADVSEAAALQLAEQLRTRPDVLGANVYTAAGRMILPEPLATAGKDGE